MRTSRSLRWIELAVLAWCLTCAAGCGNMARQAVKDGVFQYVTGSFSSAQISSQLADYITTFFTGTYTGSATQ